MEEGFLPPLHMNRC